MSILATGIMVGMALEAAEALARESIEARVVNVSTLKPLGPGDGIAVRSGHGGGW